LFTSAISVSSGERISLENLIQLYISHRTQITVHVVFAAASSIKTSPIGVSVMIILIMVKQILFLYCVQLNRKHS